MTTTSRRCGGHITLLFTVDKSTALKRSQGSKGAGFSIHHGVEISGTLHRTGPPGVYNAGITPDQRVEKQAPEPPVVSVADMHGEHVEQIDLYLDFIEACYDATLLREDERVEMNIILECPTSQGLGCRQAGLIAAGRLIHALTGRGRLTQYLKIAAHRIERAHGAGLGDVLGASVGGVELRLAPGAPDGPVKPNPSRPTYRCCWRGTLLRNGTHRRTSMTRRLGAIHYRRRGSRRFVTCCQTVVCKTLARPPVGVKNLRNCIGYAG